MRSLALILACLLSATARAETIRLTPEQAEAAIEAGASRQARAPDALAELPQSDRGVHGELGVAVGTGGYRSVYGVVGLPLGEAGSLTLGYGEERGRALSWHGSPCRSIRVELCGIPMNSVWHGANR